MRGRAVLAWFGRLPPGRVVLLGLFCAVLFEALTYVLRFGLDMQITRDTGYLRHFTGGLRIHHLYLGVLVLLVALLFRRPDLRKLLLIVGLGLAISDLIHHFLVLWPLTGSPHFDLTYPRPASLLLWTARLSPRPLRPPAVLQ